MREVWSGRRPSKNPLFRWLWAEVLLTTCGKQKLWERCNLPHSPLRKSCSIGILAQLKLMLECRSEAMLNGIGIDRV
jgi:hypothetical protein